MGKMDQNNGQVGSRVITLSRPKRQDKDSQPWVLPFHRLVNGVMVAGKVTKRSKRSSQTELIVDIDDPKKHCVQVHPGCNGRGDHLATSGLLFPVQHKDQVEVINRQNRLPIDVFTVIVDQSTETVQLVQLVEVNH